MNDNEGVVEWVVGSFGICVRCLEGLHSRMHSHAPAEGGRQSRSLRRQPQDRELPPKRMKSAGADDITIHRGEGTTPTEFVKTERTFENERRLIVVHPSGRTDRWLA